jgi:phosphoglycolate phosphatase
MIRRLLLWDIDGTLIRAGEIGSLVFDRALESVIGELPEARVRMSGKTDPQIVQEYLDLMHLDDPEHLPAVLEVLERELAAAAHLIAEEGYPCAGVPELLDRINGDDRLHQSILTGNIAPNAVVKLAAFGLDTKIDMEAGAYGSDSADRTQLVPVALRRLAELRGAVLEPDQVWVIGDTPRDLECARAGGAHCLLVATGTYAVAELQGLGADAVFADLADTEAVVEALTAGL